jgi:hypothetical protein
MQASATLHVCSEKRWTMPLGGNTQAFVTASSDTLWEKTSTGCTHRPLNLYFKCQRTAKDNEVDTSVAHLYKTVVAGKAETLMKANPNGCAHNIVTGFCGNMRGDLSECRCDALDRMKHSIRRTKFEDEVIKEILDILKPNKENFHFNLALFATGGLHGEQVLLLRLIDALKSDGYKGNIHISLIDTVYKPNIEAGYQVFCQKMQKFQWDKLIGDRKDLKQFLAEISLCLPSTLSLEGRVYGSSDDYVLRASHCMHNRHDLIIGADIEGMAGMVAGINEKAGKGRAAKVLIKDVVAGIEVPKFCALEPVAPGLYKPACEKV